MPVGRQTGHHVGANRANQPDVVAEDLVAAPLLERLLDAEREAEVDRAREVLLGAVEAVQRRQFLGAQHAERLEDLRADFVLAAVAARRRRERRAVALAAIQHHQQPVVLVVGMRGRHHEDAGVAEVSQRQAERDVSLLLVDRRDAHLRARNGDAHAPDGKQHEQQRVSSWLSLESPEPPTSDLHPDP